MKKAFTLLEIVISITIFMIILFFMYKILDDTKISNNKFGEYLIKSLKINDLNNIITEDVVERISELVEEKDKNRNSVVYFRTKNSLYNPFFNNIVYLLIEDNLVRIESLNSITKKNFTIELLEDSYIDILVHNVDKFFVTRNENKTIFVINLKNKEEKIFTVFDME